MSNDYMYKVMQCTVARQYPSHSYPPPYVNAASREANFSVVLAPLLKQLLGLGNACSMIVHEVIVRVSIGKRVPLGRLLQIM
jgi:hypothetical protein